MRSRFLSFYPITEEINKWCVVQWPFLKSNRAKCCFLTVRSGPWCHGLSERDSESSSDKPTDINRYDCKWNINRCINVLRLDQHNTIILSIDRILWTDYRAATVLKTHTHVCFSELWRHSIGVMVFTVQTTIFSNRPSPTLHLNFPLTGICLHFYFSQKNSFCMIYKPFDILWHWRCTDRSPSPCNTHVIPMSLYKLVSSYITKTNTNTHTRTFKITNRWQELSITQIHDKKWCGSMEMTKYNLKLLFV